MTVRKKPAVKMTIKEMATKIMANIPAVTTTVIRMTVANILAVTTMVIITMVVTKIMVVAINIHMMELTTKNMVMMIKQVVTVKMVFITIMETVGPSKNRIVEAVLAMIIWYNAWAAQYMLANTTVKHMWMEKPGPLKTVVTPVHVN
jgi:hypothetical protein